MLCINAVQLTDTMGESANLHEAGHVTSAEVVVEGVSAPTTRPVSCSNRMVTGHKETNNSGSAGKSH